MKGPLFFSAQEAGCGGTIGPMPWRCSGGHVRELENAGDVSCDQRLKAAHRRLITG
jgi:hypothetical protein